MQNGNAAQASGSVSLLWPKGIEEEGGCSELGPEAREDLCLDDFVFQLVPDKRSLLEQGKLRVPGPA